MPRCNIQHALEPDLAQHAGLWLDKYVMDPTDTKLHSEHVAQAAGIAEPAIYEHFFLRWKQALAQADGVQTRTARTLGRLIVGLGNESVIETAITLHRVYGLPYIPGSALKGIAAAYARTRLGDKWAANSDAYKAMFGHAPQPGDAERLPAPEKEKAPVAKAGCVTFYDALYLPHSGLHGQALHPDVMTVHHQEYYNKAQPAAPADWDDPNPVPFLSATGQFLIALGGPPAWVTAAFNILAYALAEEGVGAKTNAGYGRMAMEGFETLALLSAASASVTPAAAAPSKPVDPAVKAVDDFVASVAKIPVQNVAGQINNMYPKWNALDVPPAEKKRAAQAIVQKVREAGREKALLDRSWYIEVRRAAEG